MVFYLLWSCGRYLRGGKVTGMPSGCGLVGISVFKVSNCKMGELWIPFEYCSRRIEFRKAQVPYASAGD